MTPERSSAWQPGSGVGVAATLATALPGAQKVAPDEWRSTVRAGRGPLQIFVQQDWLVLRQRARRGRSASLFTRLEGVLADQVLAKLAVRGRRVVMVAEAPLAGLEPQTLRLLAEAVGFAVDRWEAGSGGPPAPPAAALGGSSLEGRETVLKWLDQGPYEATPDGSSDRWSLRQDEPGAGRMEFCVEEPDLAVCRSDVVGPASDLPAVCRRALLWWIASSNAWLRLARLGLNDRAGVEVRADWPLTGASPAMCEQIVEAVATAAASCGAQADALRFEPVARAYLTAHRGATQSRRGRGV